MFKKIFELCRNPRLRYDVNIALVLHMATAMNLLELVENRMGVSLTLYQGPANVSFALFTPPSSVFSLCLTQSSLPNKYNQLSSALIYICTKRIQQTPSELEHALRVIEHPLSQSDDQPDESTDWFRPKCPACGSKFGRVQERNRHVEQYLPHWILCPSPGCIWTGRRQSDFKEHRKHKHPDAGQASREDDYELYDTKDFVNSIIRGSPVDEVARSAFAKAQEGLGRLGKPDVGAKVLGRSRDLRKWIPIPSSQLN